MEIINKTLRLERDEYFQKHLFLINHVLPEQLTPKEVEVLAAFMSLQGDIASDPFCTSGRKIVRQKLNLSPGGLGNHLDSLKKKNFILEGEQLTILPILIPAKDVQGYQFKLELSNGTNS